MPCSSSKSPFFIFAKFSFSEKALLRVSVQQEASGLTKVVGKEGVEDGGWVKNEEGRGMQGSLIQVLEFLEALKTQ